MSYAADYTLATTGSFQQQVEMAMLKAAEAIGSAARTTDNVIDNKRQALATAVLANPSPYVMPFSFACVEVGLTGTPTDAQVDTAVASVWNTIAGVKSSD